jgi:hypothetical protein
MGRGVPYCALCIFVVFFTPVVIRGAKMATTDTYYRFCRAVEAALPARHSISDEFCQQWINDSQGLRQALKEVFWAESPDVQQSRETFLAREIADVFTRELCTQIGYNKSISLRIQHMCTENGIKTIGDLIKHTEADLLGAPNIGRVCINFINDVLTQNKLPPLDPR